MSLIFQKLSQWILIPVGAFLVTKVVKFITTYFWYKKRVEELEKSNQGTVDKANAATSSEEKKEATEDALKKF